MSGKNCEIEYSVLIFETDDRKNIDESTKPLSTSAHTIFTVFSMLKFFNVAALNHVSFWEINDFNFASEFHVC